MFNACDSELKTVLKLIVDFWNTIIAIWQKVETMKATPTSN